MSDKMREALEAVKHWAGSQCPCVDGEPDPCSLCGAGADKDVCKALDGTLPAKLIEQIDAALAQSRPVTAGSLPVIPDDDADFTPDLARKIIAKYQEMLTAPAAVGADILRALQASFPHFQDDAPVTADAIRSIGREYHDMVMTWEPQKTEIEFADNSGKIRKIVYEAGDYGVGINAGWVLDDDGDLGPTLSPQDGAIVTDAMCEAAIDADDADRIQGFSYEKRHVIRDVWMPHDQQEIWSAPVAGADAYQAFRKQCKIERARVILRAALALPRAERGVGS